VASLFLRVVPKRGDGNDAFGDHVLLSRESMKMLGVDEGDILGIKCGCGIDGVVIFLDLHFIEFNFFSPSVFKQGKKAVGRVIKSESLHNQCIGISTGLQQQLNILLHTRVRVSSVSHGHTGYSSVVLHQINWGEDSTKATAADANSVAASFAIALSKSKGAVPMCDGGLVYLSIVEGEPRVAYTVNFSKRALDKEPQAIYHPEYYSLVAGSNAQKPSLGAPVTQTSLAGLQEPVQSQFGGYSAAFDSVRAVLKRVLPQELSHPRQNGSPAIAGLLLCGDSACGKTSFTRCIAQEYFDSIHAHVQLIKCRLLHGQKENVIHKTMRQAVLTAAANSPSVLIWDDLDQLASAPDEDPANAASSRTAAAMAAFLARLWADLARGLGPNSSVIVIATARAPERVHPMLLASNLLEQTVKLGSPDCDDRAAIMGIALKEHELKSLELKSVAMKTEGYSPADLTVLAERIVHCGIRRLVKDKQAVIGSKCSLELEDATDALEGHVPGSLKGVSLSSSSTTWEDIGGLEDVRSILMETLELPTRYAPLFDAAPIRLRSGLLLYGPPGCGKTVVAAAVAHECGLNFVSVKGPELLNKYIGASEQSVRDLFAKAAAARPCIVFFDEFDAIAPKRGHDSTGVTDRVVNQLLTQLDGVDTVAGVYVLAATSRPDLIDAALLRPGRLDKCLLCGFPTAEDRLSIIQALTRTANTDPSIDFEDIANRTEGFTGADIQALIYNAQLASVHNVLDDPSVKANDKEESETEESRTEVLLLPLQDNKPPATKYNEISDAFAAASGSAERLSNAKGGVQNVAVDRPMITNDHIVKALGDTKPSLSSDEQQRYREMYAQFSGTSEEPRKPPKMKASLA